MREADYAAAESAAYEYLIKYAGGTLPIDVVPAVTACCRSRVMTYAEAVKALGMDVSEFYGVAASDAAFVIKRESPSGAEFLLLTSEKCGQARGRFSMAHELGHIALNHKDGARVCEIEANAFAAAYLCPRPILRATGLKRAREVAAAFGVSLKAADIALDGVNRPERAKAEIRERLLGKFGVFAGKRAEDYIDIKALADFYAARLWREKSPRVLAGAAQRDKYLDAALENRERLMEIRMDAATV